MNFEENLKNFRFTDDYRDVFDACLRFAAFLEKGGVKELQIYIDDAFKFYAAFSARFWRVPHLACWQSRSMSQI